MMDLTRLRDIREDHDISQKKMAEILGVNRSTYSLWKLSINIIPLKNYVIMQIILTIHLIMFYD